MAFRGHGKLSESWWGATVPATGPTGTSAIWVGLDFEVDTPAYLEGVRAYIAAGDDGNYPALVWQKSAKLVERCFRFGARAGFGSAGWHQSWGHPRLLLDPSIRYSLGVMYPAGKRFSTASGITVPFTQHGNIQFFNSWTSTSLAIMLASPTLGLAAPGIDVLVRTI
jgi:hypothetical protein